MSELLFQREPATSALEPEKSPLFKVRERRAQGDRDFVHLSRICDEPQAPSATGRLAPTSRPLLNRLRGAIRLDFAVTRPLLTGVRPPLDLDEYCIFNPRKAQPK